MNETTRRLNERIQNAVASKFQELIKYFSKLSYMEVPFEYSGGSYCIVGWKEYHIEPEILALEIICDNGNEGYVDLQRLEEPWGKNWNEIDHFIYGDNDDNYRLIRLDHKQKKMYLISSNDISEERLDLLAAVWIKKNKWKLEEMDLVE